MTEQQFEKFLQETGRGIHQPPETPRDEMWAAIQAARAKRREEPVVIWQRWVPWSLAAAAALALGIAVGRMSAPNGATVATGNGTEVDASAYHLAAVEHLHRVETFLTVFQSEAAVRPMDRAATSARELLSTTRLVLDSPAGRDAALAGLLRDVELVLAQIASLGDGGDSGELGFIDQGIERRGVLLKLRATAQGEL
ncbi:MAG: hypothetical protein A2W29_04075 [Gemmatimonadetes bacterium RBG_16_66_8]|nr:MAG: hypothetical protein A2W29_04075 [Gemmatimonadetes bacterium RBG_16_66_8]